MYLVEKGKCVGENFGRALLQKPVKCSAGQLHAWLVADPDKKIGPKTKNPPGPTQKRSQADLQVGYASKAYLINLICLSRTWSLCTSPPNSSAACRTCLAPTAKCCTATKAATWVRSGPSAAGTCTCAASPVRRRSGGSATAAEPKHWLACGLGARRGAAPGWCFGHGRRPQQGQQIG